jgi:hypothetical protein
MPWSQKCNNVQNGGILPESLMNCLPKQSIWLDNQGDTVTINASPQCDSGVVA